MMTVQAVLLKVFLLPTTDSLHLAAICCLPTDALPRFSNRRPPSLFIELSPHLVSSLIVAQVPPVLAGCTDATQVGWGEIAEDVMQAA